MEGILTYRSKAVGNISVEADGLFVNITATGFIKSVDIMRAYIMQGIKNFPIGIMEPCGGECIKCRRKVSLRELSKHQINPYEEFCGILLEAYKNSDEGGMGTQSDGVWEICENCEKLLIKNGFYDAPRKVFTKRRNSDGKLLLGALIGDDKPYDLMPAFSISTLVDTEKGLLGVVAVDDEESLTYYE